jgi:hypothetical protein
MEHLQSIEPLTGDYVKTVLALARLLTYQELEQLNIQPAALRSFALHQHRSAALQDLTDADMLIINQAMGNGPAKAATPAALGPEELEAAEEVLKRFDMVLLWVLVVCACANVMVRILSTGHASG